MLDKSRDSVRPPHWVMHIIKAGRSAPSADNSQPWLFFWDGDRLDLRLNHLKNIFSLGAENPAISLSMGCIIENILQTAQSLGVPDQAMQLFPEEKIYLRIDASCIHSDLVVNENPALFIRHTNRKPYALDQLNSTIIDRINKQTLEKVEIGFFQKKGDIKQVARFINKASRARFQNEQIHKWFADSLRFNEKEAARGDGLDLATLALPLGGSLLLRLISSWKRMKLLNSLGANKLFASIEAASMTKCGAIVAIYGNWDTLENAITCGRVMQRIWIILNDHDYAVQPYFVLSDQLFRLENGTLPDKLIPEVKALNDEVNLFFKLKDKQLLMLLRVGKPLGKAKKSERLQLNEILITPEKEM